MTAFITKTGDESLLVLKSKDKNGELTIYTTNPQRSYSNMHGEEAEAHTLNNSILNSIPIPSFTELPRASSFKVKTSGRINIHSDIDDVILMISIAEYAKLNLNLLLMFHQIALGWDALE